MGSSRWIIPKRNKPWVVQNEKRKRGRRNWLQWLMQRGKKSKSEENKRRSELRRKQLSIMSKADLNGYSKKDEARQKNTVNPKTSEPIEICKDVTPLSHYRSKQSYGKALKKSLNSLPSSPRKRTSVIAGLGGLMLGCQMEKRTRWNPSKKVEGGVENCYLCLDLLYYAR